MLFCWIVAESIAFGQLAKRDRRKPVIPAITGTLALASLVVLVASYGPVRDAIFAMPPLLIAMALTIALHALWTGFRAWRAWQRSHSLEQAAGQVLPKPLVAAVAGELRMLNTALIRWGAPVDVPQGTQAFAYHRYLSPMIAVFLVLQLLELFAVHFLVMLWSETVAWVLFALSTYGAIWILALLKSLRTKPILLTSQGVRVRFGMIADTLVPYEAIRGLREDFDSELAKDKATFNAAVVEHPNIMIELVQPTDLATLLGKRRVIERVAFKLDEPEAFLTALEEARSHRAALRED